MHESPTTFALEAKSLDATELESGDIELSGYAVVWDGLDAQGENFVRGSIRAAIPHFLTEAGAPLLYHHQASRGTLGQVLEMAEDDHGVKVRARVNRQSPGSALWHLYEAIRRNRKVGLSLGGYFSRAGEMISKVLRITELSVTPTAQHPLTLATAEVKALGAGDDLTDIRALAQRAQLEAGFTKAHAGLARLRGQAAMADLRASIR